MEELLANSDVKDANVPDVNGKHQKQGIAAFDTRTVKFYDGSGAYDVEFSIAVLANGEKVAYAKKFYGYDGELTKKIQAAETGSELSPVKQQPVFKERVTQDGENVKYSLSDSDGRQLSPAVQKRFGNSKVVDESGSLKVVYHGTATGEFSIFDKAKGSVEGDFGSGFYFTDNEADVSEHYEGGGPDFDNKVARLAEQIEAEEEIDNAIKVSEESWRTWSNYNGELAEAFAEAIKIHEEEFEEFISDYYDEPDR